ncbi:unnamed protein product [Prorocentrum cordatum]|uniref:Reverse transcriptase domain-containing protein n=1 Tax=Prorocentrum cordatum TaxID=2364126 RepID=A0ABN9WPW0_9DINO|nr:unnamed protein product [Polarella glacialis]
MVAQPFFNWTGREDHWTLAQDQRAAIRGALARALRPRSRAAALLLGDWNFVREPRDRLSLSDCRWAPGTNVQEHQEWATSLFDPHGFYEVFQPECTRRAAQCASRLDRACVNAHLAEQLCRSWSCAALDWCPKLSTRRPIEVARRSAPDGAARRLQIPTAPSRSKDWAPQVFQRWLQLRCEDDLRDTSHRRLLLLKRAMSQVSRQASSKGWSPQAETSEDRLGAAIRCPRAAETGRPLAVERAIRECPEISRRASVSDLIRGSADAVERLQDFIVELARADIAQDVDGLRKDLPLLSDSAAAARREGIAAKIRRLKPGGSAQVRAVRHWGGSIAASPESIAAALAAHWRHVFSGQDIDPTVLSNWLAEAAPAWARGPLPQAEASWAVTRADVAWAVRVAQNSAPGPDGMPISLWRRLGRLAVDVLHDAAAGLSSPAAAADIREAYQDDPEGPGAFNLGMLCCIPKGAGEMDPAAGAVHSPGCARPLSLVGVANRLLAAAYKRRWEASLGVWVSDSQRGFLPGRSMLLNVIELKAGAMRAAAGSRQGMVVLVDFKAAFPSVSHGLMQVCLEGFGVPEAARAAPQTFYSDSACKVSAGGALWGGFPVTSGIRQGCPLSPLVFAACMGLFLRVLQSRWGANCLIRAFADDVGIVLGDVSVQLPVLSRALDERGRLSSMQLNLEKTIGIPLWEQPMDAVREVVTAAVPAWSQLPLRAEAAYLGCVIGPGKIGEELAMARARSPVRHVYNVYALPVLSFTAQSAQVTDKLLELETWASRRAGPGPGNWVLAEDLWRLDTHYGMPRSFGRLDHLARAAQLRAAAHEDLRLGARGLADMLREVQVAWAGDAHRARCTLWAERLQASVLGVLVSNQEYMRSKGVAAARAVAALVNEDARSLTADHWAATRHKLQAELRRELAQLEPDRVHFRVRHKLSYWTLPGFPRILAERFLASRRRLERLVPPRVIAATFRTAWNGRCTARRFQQRDQPHDICMLGCSLAAKDSIQHYCRCSAVRRFHAASLRMESECLLPWWLGVHIQQARDDDKLALAALGVYAVYRATNAARQVGGLCSAAAGRALQQALREAVSGRGVAGSAPAP